MNLPGYAVLALAGFMTVFKPYVSAFAQECGPPSGFVDTPAPAVANAEQLVSHTEEITIHRPLGVVMASLNKPLKDTIHEAS
ncbi:MAG TPA: hypothetical protein VHT24_13715, partial [Pseudacidobacterium sp.]|nr:hypothetical protein [Pseudacidobacterium sp.]